MEFKGCLVALIIFLFFVIVLTYIYDIYQEYTKKTRTMRLTNYQNVAKKTLQVDNANVRAFGLIIIYYNENKYEMCIIIYVFFILKLPLNDITKNIYNVYALKITINYDKQHVHIFHDKWARCEITEPYTKIACMKYFEKNVDLKIKSNIIFEKIQNYIEN